MMEEKDFYEIVRLARVAASEAAESRLKDTTRPLGQDGFCVLSVDGRKRLARLIKRHGAYDGHRYVYEGVVMVGNELSMSFSLSHRPELSISEEAHKAIVHVLRNVDDSVTYTKVETRNVQEQTKQHEGEVT